LSLAPDFSSVAGAMLRLASLLPLVAGCALATTVVTHATDWPQWRGPQRNGISAETGWGDTWPGDGPPVAWKAKVGLGYSAFVVAQGRAYTLGHADGADTVFCFDADSGKLLWKHSYPAELGDKYFDGGTTGTPTVDGDRVYSLSRWGDLFCLEAATGKVVWSKNVQQETGARVPEWGFGGAPLVSGKLLILNVGEAGLAVDKATGTIAWKSAPKVAGYSTPLPVTHNGEELVLLASGQAYVALQPASGKEAWRTKWVTQYDVNATDPVVDGERMFLSTGYGKGGAVFKWAAGAPEQLTKVKALRTQMNTAVLVGGHLYGVDGDTSEKATLKCVEFATGAEKWVQPGFGSGALIAADGKLIALSGTGELMIAPASAAGLVPTTRAQVLGGKCWTAPVLANGRLLCRNSKGEVVCLDLRKK
jgi:outer membrane protein assembly factor BamB